MSFLHLDRLLAQLRLLRDERERIIGPLRDERERILGPQRRILDAAIALQRRVLEDYERRLRSLHPLAADRAKLAEIQRLMQELQIGGVSGDPSTAADQPVGVRAREVEPRRRPTPTPTLDQAITTRLRQHGYPGGPGREGWKAFGDAVRRVAKSTIKDKTIDRHAKRIWSTSLGKARPTK